MEQFGQTSVYTPCHVRVPAPPDYDQMAELARQLGYPSTVQHIQSRLEQMRDANSYAVFVAQPESNAIVGFIGVHIFRAIELDACAEISGLIIDEQWRSRGIGKALIDAAEMWARSRGCFAISVLSNVTRGRAHRFYERIGYEHIKTQKALRKIL